MWFVARSQSITKCTWYLKLKSGTVANFRNTCLNNRTYIYANPKLDKSDQRSKRSHTLTMHALADLGGGLRGCNPPFWSVNFTKKVIFGDFRIAPLRSGPNGGQKWSSEVATLLALLKISRIAYFLETSRNSLQISNSVTKSSSEAMN